MSATCPNGHTSESEDYCDTCGSPIDASAVSAGSASPNDKGPDAAGPAAAAGVPAATAGSSLDLDPAPAPVPPVDPVAPAGPAALECPNCATENAEGALFCEACGYDFTTGAMPRDPAGGSAMTAPSSTAAQPEKASAATGFEWLAEVWVDPDWYKTQEADDPCPSPGLPTIMPLRDKSILLGRVSQSKNTHPQIDLSSDPGVSRRHAQLTTDGKRWFVEDLGSSNGTFVGPASGPLPDDPIAVGPKTELDDDDRLYVGAWTRVVVRKATPDEVDAYA